jgi:hypothetical protein
MSMFIGHLLIQAPQELQATDVPPILSSEKRPEVLRKTVMGHKILQNARLSL